MSSFPPEFTAQIANKFELDEQRLKQVLLHAEEEHDCLIFMESGRELFKETAESFKKIKKALHQAVAEIQGCDDSEKEELEFFRMTAFKTEHFEVPDRAEDQLKHLLDLFSQFDAFYRDGPGRPPAKSSDRNPVLLSALEEFAQQLCDFWCEETDTSFGQQFESDYTCAEDDPNSGTLVPVSPASKFLFACAEQLDSRYQAKHCKTVMRKLNEGSYQGFRKSMQK